MAQVHQEKASWKKAQKSKRHHKLQSISTDMYIPHRPGVATTSIIYIASWQYVLNAFIYQFHFYFKNIFFYLQNKNLEEKH